MEKMIKRDFAYADIFKAVNNGASAKNESNCTVFLNDGSWLTTWSQGVCEGHPDERIVFSISQDMGLSWSAPQVIVASDMQNQEHTPYGIPFVVPSTGRIYLFYFLIACTDGPEFARRIRENDIDNETPLYRYRTHPLHGTGHLHFKYSDDNGKSWSDRVKIDLPGRDLNVLKDRYYGWLNHPPQIMPDGSVIFTFTNSYRNWRAWQVEAANTNIVRCENIIEENNPEKLIFTLLPEGPHGIRVEAYVHKDNPSLNQLSKTFGGQPDLMMPNFQELTVIPLKSGKWMGVGRCYLGSPAYTISSDCGRTWSHAKPLCYAPGGESIKHPMTMCPIAKTLDGRIVLLFTNNDGFCNGASHIWQGDGYTRNPQYISVGLEMEDTEENGGIVFGEPIVLAMVDDKINPNLKTGISMPQFFERCGRYFVCYNINKNDILLDELPASVLDALTPQRKAGGSI